MEALAWKGLMHLKEQASIAIARGCWVTHGALDRILYHLPVDSEARASAIMEGKSSLNLLIISNYFATLKKRYEEGALEEQDHVQNKETPKD
jgi:hypothetical protein